MSEQKEISLAEFDGAGFKVVVDEYSGPIDLLLHLVKSNELEIEQISLAQITNQYLACLDAMRKLDLEVAGEYLVIAATLLSIKSSVLLNEPVQLVLDDEGNLFDPHEELLKRLREAAIYREGAQSLGALDCLGQEVFAAKSQLRKFKPEAEEFADHNPMLLGRAFRRVLLQLESRGLKYVVSLEPISIVDTMVKVMDRLKLAKNSTLEFSQLLGEEVSKSSLIATFIALLELCKRQAITVRQGQAYDEILISQINESAETEYDSEFDSENQAIVANA